MSASDDDIAELLDMSDKEFAEVILDALEAHPNAEDSRLDWECLFDARVIKRTRTALGVLTFTSNIGAATLGRASSRLRESGWAAKAHRQAAHADLQSQRMVAFRRTARELALAIHAHRAAVTAEGESTDADRTLWRTLSEMVPSATSPKTLEQLIGTGKWS